MDTANIYIIMKLFCRDRDETLFAQVRKPGHCLNVLLPPERIMPMTLRPRRHNYVVPDFIYEQYKSSFINRCISMLESITVFSIL